MADWLEGSCCAFALAAPAAAWLLGMLGWADAPTPGSCCRAWLRWGLTAGAALPACAARLFRAICICARSSACPWLSCGCCLALPGMPCCEAGAAAAAVVGCCVPAVTCCMLTAIGSSNAPSGAPAVLSSRAPASSRLSKPGASVGLACSASLLPRREGEDLLCG